MIYKFKKKSNPDDDVLLDAPTKVEAQKKLRGMVERVSEYEEVECQPSKTRQANDTDA